jgi:hypothetical protein
MTDNNYFVTNEEYTKLVVEAGLKIEYLLAENEKLRLALIDIQWKIQDILRPMPFQDE